MGSRQVKNQVSTIAQDLAGDPKARIAAGGALVGGAVAALKAGLDRREAARTEAERRFRLRREEPLADGLRRIARGQIDGATERLRGDTAESLGTAVHESRKGFKRLRTVVRLARDDLGDETYRRENSTFRDLGRSLAEVRDREVLVETLDGLLESHPDELPEQEVAEFRRGLVADRDAARGRLEADEDRLAEAVAALGRARARTADWVFDHPDFRAIRPGLRRIYRRGRRGMRAARDDPSSENLHEWRKRVKDLWYAAQILRPAAPKRMKALASDAHRTSNLLGKDHDLAVLGEEARRREGDLDEAALIALEGLIERRRAELSRRALREGADLYSRKPRRFVARVERAWGKRVGAPA